jgi:hypothetical protein
MFDWATGNGGGASFDPARDCSAVAGKPEARDKLGSDKLASNRCGSDRLGSNIVGPVPVGVVEFEEKILGLFYRNKMTWVWQVSPDE